ncbi:MAG: DedA family protein [Phycisphaerae bacterium]|nr:DedA family protein [Phycisphaerae bacterium]
MEYLREFTDFFLHLDKSLETLIAQYGNWTYAILFVVIFAETGLVVTPFLPGDSLLFAAGIFAARGSLSATWIFILLTISAVIGDAVNYSIGKYLGPKVLNREKSRIFKREYLEKTHAFYEKYGGKTIIIARFVPIVRTFAPFVAGVGTMTYSRFFMYNVVGAILWVAICTLAGYFLGSIPIIANHFELAVLAIIAVSVMPMVIEFWKARNAKKKSARSAPGLATDNAESPAADAAGV